MRGADSLAPLKALIDERLGQKRRVVAGIDGRAASGKTTAAGLLRASYADAAVISLDDFFLQRRGLSEARLSETGGNIDYERFLREVKTPLLSMQSFSYGVYDCKSGVLFEGAKTVDGSARLIIIEGAYAMRRDFLEMYDVKAFFDVSQETQRERIALRQNPSDFFEKWIPKEESYFRAFDVEKQCQIVIRFKM
ncbi:MAG: hypothetical protein LBQ40_06880 [Clostridiales bacterium]|jgi:uridine kinase|nr:hypothetical protein [Clostridiales bacterium]